MGEKEESKNQEGFQRWIITGLPILFLVGTLTVVVLRFGRGLSWGEVAIPVTVFAILQAAVFIAMFWAGKRAREQKDYRALTILTGLYCWSSGLLLLHYGIKWGFLAMQFGRNDFVLFSAILAAITVIAWAFFSLRK